MKDHYPWRTWLDKHGIRHAVMRDAEGILIDRPIVPEAYCHAQENFEDFSRDPELIPTCSYCRATMAKWHEDADLIRRSMWLRGRREGE
jgi:hypothetical protein